MRSVLRMGRDANETGACPQGSLPAQPHGARHPGAATDDQDMAEFALVGIPLPGRQDFAGESGVDTPKQRRLAGPAVRWNLQAGEIHRPRPLRAVAEVEAAFQANEGDRGVGTDRRAEHGARVAVQPGRHVEREDRCGMFVGGIDNLGIFTRDFPFESATQKPIDDQVRFRIQRTVVCRHGAAKRGEVHVCGGGVTGQ